MPSAKGRPLPLAAVSDQTHEFATVSTPAHAAVVTFCEVVPPLERLRYSGPLRVIIAFRLLAPRMGARPLAHSTLLHGLATGGEARRARNERIGLLRSVDY